MKHLSLLLLPFSLLVAGEGAGVIDENDSDTERFRLVWTNDPTTTATIGWNQKSGEPGVVHFGPVDFGRKHHLYPKTRKVHRSHRYDETTHNCFARITDLQPDTRYFFCIRDHAGVSRRLTFKTAPEKPQSFTFIAGGRFEKLPGTASPRQPNLRETETALHRVHRRHD